MGNEVSTEIGIKSSRSDQPEDNTDIIDYSNPKNSRKAKQELYNLFLNNKISLNEDINEFKSKIQSLEQENEKLKSEVKKYMEFSSQLHQQLGGMYTDKKYELSLNSLNSLNNLNSLKDENNKEIHSQKNIRNPLIKKNDDHFKFNQDKIIKETHSQMFLYIVGKLLR